MSFTKKNKQSKKEKKNRTKKNLENKCKNFFNVYNTFEDKFEKVYGDIYSSKDFDLEKSDIQELKKAVSPSNINPQNDFYSYINERWINQKVLEEEQKYIVQVDSFRLVQDKVYKELLEIVNDYIKHNNDTLSKQLKNFYNSQLKLNTDQQTKKYSMDFLNTIDKIRENGNVWELLGLVNNNEVISFGAPFSWT